MRSGLDVVFRKFRDTDAREVSRFILENKRVVQADLRPERWERILRFDSPGSLIERAKLDAFYVVSKPGGGLPLGIIGFTRYSGTEAEPVTFSVDRNFRGLGLGKLLAAESLLSQMAEGITRFHVIASPMSQGIFSDLGFVEDSRLARLVSRGTFLSLRSEGDSGLIFLGRSMIRGITETEGAT
ncbi:MAG: hypothetical protein V1827_04080 [Candidatus Micrarchaeota archaeon]